MEFKNKFLVLNVHSFETISSIWEKARSLDSAQNTELEYGTTSYFILGCLLISPFPALDIFIPGSKCGKNDDRVYLNYLEGKEYLTWE